MPDSFGKRNREKVKAKKAEARDDRRIARSQRRKGIVPLPDRDRPDAFEKADTPDAPEVATGDTQPDLAADA